MVCIRASTCSCCRMERISLETFPSARVYSSTAMNGTQSSQHSFYIPVHTHRPRRHTGPLITESGHKPATAGSAVGVVCVCLGGGGGFTLPGHAGVTHLSSETTFLLPAVASKYCSMESTRGLCVYWEGGGLSHPCHFQGNGGKNTNTCYMQHCQICGAALPPPPPQTTTQNSCEPWTSCPEHGLPPPPHTHTHTHDWINMNIYGDLQEASFNARPTERTAGGCSMLVVLVTPGNAVRGAPECLHCAQLCDLEGPGWQAGTRVNKLTQAAPSSGEKPASGRAHIPSISSLFCTEVYSDDDIHI